MSTSRGPGVLASGWVLDAGMLATTWARWPPPSCVLEGQQRRLPSFWEAHGNSLCASLIPESVCELNFSQCLPFRLPNLSYYDSEVRVVEGRRQEVQQFAWWWAGWQRREKQGVKEWAGGGGAQRG